MPRLVAAAAIDERNAVDRIAQYTRNGVLDDDPALS